MRGDLAAAALQHDARLAEPVKRADGVGADEPGPSGDENHRVPLDNTSRLIISHTDDQSTGIIEGCRGRVLKQRAGSARVTTCSAISSSTRTSRWSTGRRPLSPTWG